MPVADESQNMGGKPTSDFKLFQIEQQKKFNLDVAMMKKAEETRKAVHKKYVDEQLAETVKAAENEYNRSLGIIDKTYQARLKQIEALAGADADSIEAAEDLRKEAYNEYIKSKQALEAATTSKQQKNVEELKRQQEEAELHVNEVASLAAQNRYNQATIFERQKIQQEKANLAQRYAEESAQEQKAHEQAVARLRAEQSLYSEGTAEYTKYQFEIESHQNKAIECANNVTEAEQQRNAALQESSQLTNLINQKQIEYINSDPTHVAGAAKLLNEIEQKLQAERLNQDDLKLQLAISKDIGLDTTNLEQALANSEDIAESLANQVDSLRSAAASDAADKAHTESVEKVAQIRAQDPKDMARAIADSVAEEKANNDMNAKAQWEYFNSEQGRKDNRDKAIAQALENATAKLGAALDKIDENISAFYEYQAEVEARLQGSQESYQKSLNNIAKNVGISGLVSQKEVIQNIKKLVDQGVAYDLDLRAFLATVSDRVVNTFDVFDSNLLRLIRLQQSDTTAARLGMEASLTRLFNQYFSDSSYLSDAFDSVSQAILDANGQLTKNASIEFEYMVQKWLGALYSLGFSDSTINTIAQGLNYLGTGNVEALNSNESLQSLLAMSASRAGISYADILTGGLDAQTTNSLLKSMIEYLKSIADNTENNQVTKSAYTNVFGFNISDLTAVSSLRAEDIQNLFNSSLNYNEAMTEVSTQLNQIASRTHMSTLLSTAFDNAMVSASTAIGGNIATYATWMVLNVIEDLTGGISIPGVSVLGNMVDLHATVTGLAKAGVAGLGLMGSLLTSLFNGSFFGTMDLDKWGYDEYTSRGGPLKGIAQGTVTGTSGSTEMNMVGSASSKDIKTTALTDSTADAEEDAKITNANVQEAGDIYDKIYESLADKDTTVLSEAIQSNYLMRESRVFKASVNGLDEIPKLLDPSRIFYSMLVGMLPVNQIEYNTSSGLMSVKNSTITSALKSAGFSSYWNANESVDSYTYKLNTTSSSSNSSNSNNNSSGFFSSNDSSGGIFSSSIYSSDPEIQSVVQHLENMMSQADLQTISSLMAATTVSNNTTTTNIITPNGLRVSVTDMSPELKAYLAATMRQMVSSALNGDPESEGEESQPFANVISGMLSNLSVNANITNDYFDSALQKSMMPD